MQHVKPTNLPNDALNIVQPWADRFDGQIAELESKLVDVRRHIHAHPEPSGEETETSRFLARQLNEAGLSAAVCRDGIGVVADTQLGPVDDSTPLIAIRADIDALRMSDDKTVDYKSQNEGVNHACGHDAHSTMTLGVALAAAALTSQPSGEQQQLPYRLRFLFQPAEETSMGAKSMVAQNVLEGVDGILALHVDPEKPVGQVGIRYGVLTANCDDVSITIEGHGGHGARPHHTIDPVAAAVQMVNALYKFLPRSVDSRNPSVFTIGQINGGYAPNVIPARVELRGSLRTTDENSRETLKRRVQEIADGIETISGATIHFDFSNPLKSVDNHPLATAALEAASRSILGTDNIVVIDRPSMGGEDFSAYLEHVPGALLRLGCAPPDAEDTPFLHSPVFDVDERCLALGSRILIRAALLFSVGLRQEVVED